MEWILVAGGAFAICGAICNWDWFMNNRKAQFFVRLFGRTGTRYFYGLLGTGLIIVGVLIQLGIIQNSQ